MCCRASHIAPLDVTLTQLNTTEYMLNSVEQQVVVGRRRREGGGGEGGGKRGGGGGGGGGGGKGRMG